MLTITGFFRFITIVQNYRSSSSITTKFLPNPNKMGSLLPWLTRSIRDASLVSHELTFKKKFNRDLEERMFIAELRDTFWKHVFFLEFRVWDSVCRWPGCSLIPNDDRFSQHCIAIRPGDVFI
ncbi:hypothetical protein FoTM2_016277 [Fusarium oxysporum f. sp. vasinfectum]|uniref:Uncharacterized protein n=1 Tax=Fusarium oxysporum f. sp. vasinfectum 25433 TaxID=1089449 RepID=X0L3K3_FUSOX|nr:hypothetical protein FOTG_16087 [Fusarium oxysporum f. sp. vasinfectum 25433]KAK2924119.1 hypothetical protein FoTM2_016277 [Fusarium oxysporum f. sp. vasinfectum]